MQIDSRFRGYPTPSQEPLLFRGIGYQRFIDHAKVSGDQYVRTFAGKALVWIGVYPPIDRSYHQFVSDLPPWLRGTFSVVPNLQWSFKQRVRTPRIAHQMGAQQEPLALKTPFSLDACLARKATRPSRWRLNGGTIHDRDDEQPRNL